MGRVRHPPDPEILRIRETIAREGVFVANRLDRFSVFCHTEESTFAALARLAIHEKWAFAFLPNGTVEITNLPSAD
jgi:hypothetical protein